MHPDHVVELSRLQFAFTAIFHILWPILTISLAAFLFVLEVLWVRTGDVAWYRHARFWSRLLLLNFAVGVVSGIPMEFEFGTNWSGFSGFSGPFFGNILGFEGAMAFMLEAGFIGIMMFGWERVPRAVHLFATGMVAAGSSLSAFWIMVANSWMQTPAGVTVVDGRIVVTDYLRAIFNPDAWWSIGHMWVAALETGLVVVAGISAWYLLKRRSPAFFTRSFRLALLMLVFVAPLQLWLGDGSGGDVFRMQPAKGAAIEGHWHTNAPGTAAPWSLLAWPNAAAQRNDWSIELPGVLSLLATHRRDGVVIGLADIPRQDQPPMLPLLYYAFRAMAGIGFLFVLLVLVTARVLYRTRRQPEALAGHRTLMWAWLLAIPLPYLAVECGWIVREVGRQPWLVYGLLRTDAGVSTAISAPEVGASLAMFAVFYAVLLATFAWLALRWLRQGPDEALPAPLPPAAGVPAAVRHQPY